MKKVLVISNDNVKRIGELKSVAKILGDIHEIIVITLDKNKKQIKGEWEKAWITNEMIGANIIESIIELSNSVDYIISSGDLGLSISPILSVKIDASLITEVTDVEKSDDTIIFVHPIYGGKAIAKYKAKKDKVVVSLRENYFDPDPLEGETEAEELLIKNKKVELLEVKMEATEGISLEDASVIVSGGRGIGGKDGFKELFELAKLLDGAVGASRAAVDAGWVPNSLQIGQTGTVVAPDLYIAIGISGATQHLAGISNAKIVVAINKDEEAPIFSRARYGIVADWKEFLPIFKEKIKQLKENEQ